jgi:amidase
MTRRELLTSATAISTGGIVGSLLAQDAPQAVASPLAGEFEWEEATIVQVGAAMKSAKLTSESLTRQYLDRIHAFDKAGPELRAVIEENPDALTIANALDEEYKAKGPRGPLRGIPVLIKDNIATHDRMLTTAGSLALVGSRPPGDAFLVERLRAAGAVILGKTNLSEWANFRSNSGTSGWSGRGGLTKNPYALDRNPSGSSSGSAVAVAANLCAVAVGTETDGSIVSPSSVCGIVGIKPTVGLIGRGGIIPISRTQDTAGPMARTVTDAAILLGALAGVDPHDPATDKSRGKVQPDYTQFLDRGALRGARIGVLRQFFQSRDKGVPIIEAAIARMKEKGAVIVDPVDMPSVAGLGRQEFKLMLYEFKAGINAYLAWLGEKSPVHTLTEIIEFNKQHSDKELAYFGQEILLAADAMGPLTEKEYLEAAAECRLRAGEQGIDFVMDKHHLDALVAPTAGPATKTDLMLGNRALSGSSSPAAVAGYPNITAPAGQISGLPVGISFFGRAWSEPTLLKLAYAFEQACGARKAPKFPATVG